MSQGVLLVAMGHSNYGDMAYNLAASIRYGDKNTPIHLAWAGDAIKNLTPLQKKQFTSMSEVPHGVYANGGKLNYIRTKVFLYELSPFDTTIYIDVDTIFLKRPISWLFNELKDVDFTITNEGFLNEKSEVVNQKYSFWADTNMIHVAYLDMPGFETGKLYMCRSEFMYFKKCEKNQRYFDLAKDIYDNPRIDVSEFANGIPDEFAFNVAGRILHHYPHRDQFTPIFWEYLHNPKRPQLTSTYEAYYAYSIGGNMRNEKERDIYNQHVQFYSKQLGVRPHFLLTKSNDKKSILPERVKL